MALRRRGASLAARTGQLLDRDRTGSGSRGSFAAALVELRAGDRRRDVSALLWARMILLRPTAALQ
jgi:hypothetical protein